MSGILWASVISKSLTYEIVDPILIYKKIFHKNVLCYFSSYFRLLTLIFVDGAISYIIAFSIPIGGLIGVFIKMLVLSVLFNSIFVLATQKTKSMQSMLIRIRGLIHELRVKYLGK